MSDKKNIHPSIIAALQNEDDDLELIDDLTFDEEDEEEIKVERFTFGDKEPTIIDGIKAIIELSKNSMLNDDFYFEAEEALKYISERLQITQGQAIMLSLVVDNFIDQRIDITDFGRHLRCSPISLLPLISQMKGLEERGFIVCNDSGNRPTYRIPYAVLEALNANKVPQQRDLRGLTCKEVMNELENIFEQREDQEISTDGMKNRCMTLLKSNSQLNFVERVMSYNLDEEESMLLLYFVNLFVNYNDNAVTHPQINNLYDHRTHWIAMRQKLQTEKCRLQELGIMEFGVNNGLGDRNSFCLSLTAKRELFAELDINIAEEKPCRGLLNYKAGYYYVPAMGGSTSIKYVLPALWPNEPSLNYHNLDERCQNGGAAMTIFPRIKDMDPEEQKVTRKALLDYCGLDTFAMVKVWERLKEQE